MVLDLCKAEVDLFTNGVGVSVKAGFPNRSVFRGIGPHADLFDLRGPQKVCIAVQKSTFF